MMMKWIFLFWLIKLIFKKQVKKNQISCVFQFTKFNFSIRIAIVNNRTLLLINDFLHQYSEPFKAKDLQNYIVENDGQKVSVKNLLQILYDSPYVFPIKNNQFIARAGVFAGRWFSFKPSREEIQKGYFMIGHRATPFANPDIPPDYYSIFANEKLVEPESCTFSMNQALDNYSLFGEGYILPIMFNDRNSDVVLRKENTQLNLPTEITLTAWPLSKVSGGEKIQYGDRMLCRFLDWDNGVIEIILQKKNEVLALSQEGDMKAQFSLGRCYLYGEHVKKSYENAFKWFKLSAEQGFAMSQQELGLLYYEGNGVKQSFAEAVKWYRKSAEQGYSYGEHCLGVCYERGEGVQQSYEDAVQWYMKAANHGLDVSKINLALLLEAGNGTPQNLETAYNIFSELAQKGNSRAQLFLADYYRQGIFVKQDMNEAIKWYIEAANQGEEEAVAWLQELGVVKSSEN